MSYVNSQLIESACLVYLNTNLSLTPTTNIEWPNTTLDEQAIDDWIRIRLRGVRSPKQRKTNYRRGSGELLVNLFAKHTTTMYRIMDMSVAVSDVYKHAEIDIQDWDNGEAVVGGIRVFEPMRNDNSQAFNEPIRTDVKVMGLKFPFRFEGSW